MAVENTQLYDPARVLTDFVFPAHSTRYTYEIITHPRNKQFFRPSEACIAKGTYMFKKCRCDWHDPVLMECDICKNVAALPKLIDNNYRVIRANIDRKDSSSVTKKNVLLTYPDDAFVSFVQFELDRHYPDDPIPDDIQRVDAAFWEQVKDLKEVMQEIGFDVVWTISPGNVNPLTGEICHGLYAWVKLQGIEIVTELRTRIKEFKEYHCLDDIECCWDRRNNNTRLPGQTWTQLADSETATILEPAPVDQPQMSLITFAKAWEALQAVSVDILFSASRSWFSQASQHTDDTSVPEKAPGMPSVTNVSPTPVGESIESPTAPQPLAPTQAFGHPDYSVETAQAEPNTFTRATRRLICSRLTRKYRGNKKYLQDAVIEGMEELKSISPATSKTCSDPKLLESTMSRWMNWYFQSFDNKKMKGTWSKRDQEDQDRFSYSSELDISILLPLLKKRFNLQFHELSLIKKIYFHLRKFTGRLAAKFLYGGQNSLCSRKAWFSLSTKLKGVLIVLDEFGEKKCRQWAFGKDFVAQVKHVWVVKQEVQGLIQEEGEEKKEKGVYEYTATPAATKAPAHPGSGTMIHEKEDMPTIMTNLPSPAIF